MKIMYVLPWISGYGGISRSILMKANYMVRKWGYDIEIITFCNYSDVLFELDERIKVTNLQLFLFEQPPLKRMISLIKSILIIKNKIRSFCPDILISLSTVKETSWLWMLNDKSKKVLEVHSSFYFVFGHNRTFTRVGKILNYFSSQLIKLNINKSDAYVVLTERDKMLYEKHNVCSPVVIPNANPLTPNSISQLNTKIVSCVGRLSPEKNFESALRIWKKVHVQFPDWVLHIYGDGEEKPKLLEMVDLYKLSGSVVIEFAEDMNRVYTNTSILMMTSLYEGLPMTLIEGLSYGLPCIAYDIDCGPSDIIKNGYNGYLIPPFDEDIFAQKLMKMMRDNDLRSKQGNHSLEISKKFSQDDILNKWKLLFKNI